ncbi:hypothetical protein GQ464_002265 [Rhodocaloribacter litoris]|uniref:hypothetical protein n=1 Tax=Rhodocaloribacter litoris TaxID=2558931 RepID=UPI00141F91C0|nr:hypothetical protein [Rhodocaloribacter litoris]QXD15794.1 hypothetical protein GQ464_002265 [Rhodocaloribacter litoris]
MSDTLTLEALKEQLDRLCGLVEAMRETSEVRFSRRDEAAERLHRRVDRLEGELRHLKDDLHCVRSDVAHRARGW